MQVVPNKSNLSAFSEYSPNKRKISTADKKEWKTVKATEKNIYYEETEEDIAFKQICIYKKI